MIDAVLAQGLPSVLTGLAAATCLTAAPVFRTRRTILAVQLAAGLFFAAHYFCLGVAVASLVNILGMVQTGAAMFSARGTAMKRLGYALIVLMVLVGLWFWQGPVSALSVAATALIALARMQQNQVWLRLLLLGGGSFWIAHDFVAEAWIAFTADIGAAITCAAGLLALKVRIRFEWRDPRPLLAQAA